MKTCTGFCLIWLFAGVVFGTTCSVFNTTLPDGRTLVGRNLDWVASSTGRVDFLQRGVGRYGAMLFFIDDDIWPQGGMNDQGLVLGMTATPYLRITPDPDKLPRRWARHVMKSTGFGYPETLCDVPHPLADSPSRASSGCPE